MASSRCCSGVVLRWEKLFISIMPLSIWLLTGMGSSEVLPGCWLWWDPNTVTWFAQLRITPTHHSPTAATNKRRSVPRALPMAWGKGTQVEVMPSSHQERVDYIQDPLPPPPDGTGLNWLGEKSWIFPVGNEGQANVNGLK